MESPEDDADNIFDLGEDDEDAGNPIAALPVAEVEEGEGVMMESDPYNPDEWDDTLGKAETEEDTSALLFDEDNGHEDGFDEGNSHDDGDLHSLMDRGLEEIDDLLSTKGRLNAVGPPKASSEGHMANTRNHRRASAAAGTDDPDDGLPGTTEEGTAVAAGGGGGWEQPKGDIGRSAPDSAQSPQHRSARGTGANAASALMSATAPMGYAGAVGDYSSLGLESKKRGLGESSTAEMINGVNSNGPAPCGSEEVIRSRDGVRSYFYEAGALHGSGNADHLYSPPRRREKKVAPFIQAKGLTLTYAQARLFGLAGSPHPAGGVTKRDLDTHATWPRSVSQSQTIGGARCTGLGGSAQNGRQRQHQRNPGRTYSPSRMEKLSHPLPGRGRLGDSCMGRGKSAAGQREGVGGRGGIGGEGKAAFTWKRSRKAEAAMRDPACGYDFVREAGYSREDFLGRVEAYSSYSRQKLETRRGEDQYAAKLDKLECPQCHNPQSYDEFVGKKLKCGGCDVAYCLPRAWNRRVWDQRDEMRIAKSEERKARIEREAGEEFLKRMPKQTRHAALLRQRVGQVGFIRRMRRDLQQRRAREDGAGRSHGSQDGGEGRCMDRQDKGAPHRPASAPTTTITNCRTAAMASKGAIAKAGGQEGNEDKGVRTTPKRSLRSR